MESFNNLNVNQYFIDKLKERSIVKPTAIQSLVIPKLLEGENILFRSETGTGKTFAYLLPALQRLIFDEKNADYQRGPSVIICAPTLELSSQIKTEIDFLTSSLERKLQTALLIGSVSIDRQIDSLKKTSPVVIVGNPGRMLILAKMRKLKLQHVKFLVLDEADRLTAQECLEETKELLAFFKRDAERRETELNPSVRAGLQVAACSATVSKKTCAQLGPLFQSAVVIESDTHEILRERIEHWAIFSEKRRKTQTLRSLLAALKKKKSRIKALIFTSRNDEAALVLSRLQYHHVAAAGLFGKVNKKPITGAQRKEALDSFRGGKVEALVSTDLAARGLDIPGITHVIALDVPADGEAYIHRCGRTGRAQKRGIMITIGDETQMHLLASLEKKLKIRVQPKELYEGRICAT